MKCLMQVIKILYSKNNIKTKNKCIEYLKIYNNRVSPQCDSHRTEVIKIFKYAIKYHDQNNKNKMRILFKYFKKFFNYGIFLSKLIKFCNNSRNFKDKKSQRIYLYYLLHKTINEENILFFRFSDYYKLFSKRCKRFINRYYEELINDVNNEINIPLVQESYPIERTLDKRLHFQLINYLKLKHIDGLILDRKITCITNTGENGLTKFLNRRGISWNKFIKFIKKEYIHLRFIVCFLSMRTPNKEHRHRNVLIYDRLDNSIERFEPHGKTSPRVFNEEEMDKKIYKILKKHNIIYRPPKTYLPTWGPQNFQTKSIKEKEFIRYGEPGRCIPWSAWYADIRLSNPDISRDILIKHALLMIKKDNRFLTNYIRNYMFRVLTLENIVKITDNYILETFTNEYTEDKNIDSFINKFSILTFMALSIVNIDEEKKLYINGKPLCIYNNNIKHTKDLKKIKYKYGDDIIKYKEFINILKSKYIVDYLHLSEGDNDINISSLIKYIGKVYDKFNKRL